MEVENASCSIEGFINLVCRVPNDSPCEGALSGTSFDWFALGLTACIY